MSHKRLLIPGPTETAGEVLQQQNKWLIGHRSADYTELYTGIIYKAMGFPTKMYPVLFAIGRLPGWIAQWREMMSDPVTKLGRPRQIYTGPTERPYVPITAR